MPKVGSGNGLFSIFSEENLKHILKDNFKNYVKGPAFRDCLGEFLGDGIFASDGKAWKHHRKVASNMFSRNLMRNGTTVAIKQLEKVVEKLNGIAASGSTVDMQVRNECMGRVVERRERGERQDGGN